MEETILQNELVREALKNFCKQLQKNEKLEYLKAKRSVAFSDFENHFTAYSRHFCKRLKIESVLSLDAEILYDSELVIEALVWYSAVLEKTESAEYLKAIRSITDDDFNKHDSISSDCCRKRVEIEKLLQSKAQIFSCR